MCEFGDGDGADFHSFTRPKARKEHRCDDCGATIKRGETYLRAWWVYDGATNHSKCCLPCSEAADKFEKHHDAAPFPGGLADVLVECVKENFEGGGGWMRWGRLLVAMKRRRAAQPSAGVDK